MYNKGLDGPGPAGPNYPPRSRSTDQTDRCPSLSALWGSF